MATISLECLINPVHAFAGLPRDAVIQTITIPSGARDDDLETEIRNQLPPQFKNVPFIIRAFHPGGVRYRVVQPQTLISDYFKEGPPA
ncbi:1726_t:CDS:1, partial [Acaulospora colombiana]